MRIIFVPQFPSEMRYQAWWFSEFPKQFRDRGFDVLILGEDYANMIKHRRSTLDMFSPINQAIEFETEQVKEFMLLDIKPDDILFVSDISFPGIFCNVLYHKKCSKMYAFCHATSINILDYFQSVAHSKFPVESAHADMFDCVFVGSKYHQDKLINTAIDTNKYGCWKNTKVTYLPFTPHTPVVINNPEKTIDIMSASRPSVQKVDSGLEAYIEKELDVEIQRPVSNTWGEYYRNLQASKVLLITSHEDTFGYQIVDAVTNKCTPLARNSCAYPELLEREYLYETPYELLSKIEFLINMDVPVQEPRLLCKEQMNNFYDVICSEMKGKKEYPF